MKGSNFILAVAGIANLATAGWFICADKPIHAISFAIICISMCILARKE